MITNFSTSDQLLTPHDFCICSERQMTMHRSMTLLLAYLNNRLQFFTTNKMLTKEHMSLFVVKHILFIFKLGSWNCPLHSISKINCHREIKLHPRIKPATPIQQIWFSTYWDLKSVTSLFWITSIFCSGKNISVHILFYIQ